MRSTGSPSAASHGPCSGEVQTASYAEAVVNALGSPQDERARGAPDAAPAPAGPLAIPSDIMRFDRVGNSSHARRPITCEVLLKSPFVAKRTEGMAVIKAVCEAQGFRVDHILSPSHLRQFIKPRRDIARALRERQWSLPQIGALMRRDHTTVLHMLRSDEEREEVAWMKKIQAVARAA